MIEVNGLSKSYGPHHAVRDLNFKIDKGEVVGFLGPNGAGKTTSMKIITGYMAPTSGQVKVAGYDVFEDPVEVKKRIGYLPETPPVYGDMSVKDYLRFVARLKGVGSSDLDSKLEDALKKTHLQEVQGRLIQNLSKGFRQRVGIAQAIVSNPEVLILDEPTVGLDPKQVAEIRELINQLKGQHTIVLSTHILSEVQATCEKVIIINQGKIVAQDSLTGLSRRMSGSQRLTVKVRRNFEQLSTELAEQDGVVHVEKAKMKQQLYVDLTGEEDQIEAVASYIVKNDYGLIELQSQDLSLEDIFLKLTSDDLPENHEKESKEELLEKSQKNFEGRV